MCYSTSLNVRRVRTEGLVCCVRFKESNLTVIHVLVCNISCQNQQIGSCEVTRDGIGSHEYEMKIDED